MSPRVTLRAVLFDVDFTLARPGPELGPEGYARAGERHGLRLDPARYEAARDAALVDLLAVEPAEAVMVGDTIADDVEGALALGMRAILLDREGLHPDFEPRAEALSELPPLLELAG